MYKWIHSHSFVKFDVDMKSQSHITRFMKSAIISICQGLSVKNMFKNYHKDFGQFVDIFTLMLFIGHCLWWRKLNWECLANLASNDKLARRRKFLSFIFSIAKSLKNEKKKDKGNNIKIFGGMIKIVLQISRKHTL